MSTLTYTTGTFTPTASAPRKPLWRRIMDGLIESQQRRADREIARYLITHGGLFTDDMERQIMRQLTERRALS